MVLEFSLDLAEALEKISLLEHFEWEIHNGDEARTDEIIEKYGEAKWQVVELLNECYGHLLAEKFDLHNWLDHNQDDEVAYFLNEAGSNSLNHSEYQAPAKFHLWIGKEGFIIGIEQKGQGFNAKEVDNKMIRSNEGAAFSFFRSCKSQIFFDDAEKSKIVFLKHQFKGNSSVK